MNREDISKTIAKHPGVLELDWGESSGVDYKYEVFLREGWIYQNGRMQGSRCGHFDTIDEFKFANPVAVPVDALKEKNHG